MSDVIVVNISGGLGNQMFQYAAGCALANRLGRKLSVVCDMHTFYGSRSHYQLKNIFNIQVSEIDQQDMRRIFGWRGGSQVRRLMSKPLGRWLRDRKLVFEPHFHYWSAFERLVHVTYLHGYWQSDRYFKGHETAIRQAFSFVSKPGIQDMAVIDLMRQQASVAVHVRRGDYTNAKNRQVYVQADLAYYKRAIQYFKSTLGAPKFFVFSDDPAWVREHLLVDESMVLVDHNSGETSFNDMRLMSLASHNIIANSTFSWWGAWLNENPNKQVVAPRGWFQSEGMNSSDVCPDSWIKL